MNDDLPRIDFAGHYTAIALYTASFAVLIPQGVWMDNGWFIFAGTLGVVAVILDAIVTRNDHAKDRILREQVGLQADLIDRLNAELERTRRLYQGDTA